MIEIDIRKKLSSSEGYMALSVCQNIDRGELIALYGPSGSGKSSILNILAGIMTPDLGVIKVDHKEWFNHKTGYSVGFQKRKLAYMFQDYALFPNMTILENISFAVQDRTSAQFVRTLINDMGLDALAHKKPSVLSGGQQQRVALARAVAQRPKILLLDEPLSALDAKVRMQLQDTIHDYHRLLNLTTIIVSHDIAEIVKLADRVWKLEDGKIVENATPKDMFFKTMQNNKFQFTGEILSIEPRGNAYAITVLITNKPIQLIMQKVECKDFTIGDKVVVLAKEFKPLIYKI